MALLQVRGKDIVNQKDEKVYLRGVSFGGWLNMENFITGYIGSESSFRKTLREELGEERYNVFMDSFLDSFIREEDFKFLAELGATVVRVPFNYRHFEDDLEPGQYKSSAFKYLDRAINWAKKYGIYVILDLHAAQGWQNESWHSDNTNSISLLWSNRDYQKRVIDLWTYIADYYKDEEYIAGYDLLNEPDAPDVESINRLYRELVENIRKVDKKHIIFLEANNYSKNFRGFEEPFDDNLAYSSHNYCSATHSARRYPGPVANFDNSGAGLVYVDRDRIEKDLLERNGWVMERGRPSWIGEFGALFDGDINNPLPCDLERLKALKDQLDIFNQYEQHWTIWTYKDIGVQGLVVSDPESVYLKRIKASNELKKELGLDAWTARTNGILRMKAMEIANIVGNMVQSKLNDNSNDYRIQWHRRLGRYAICGAVADLLAVNFAALFVDMTAEEIKMMNEEAFAFENTIRREYLIDVLKNAFIAK